jgi:anti-anti-sigma regulatory factor
LLKITIEENSDPALIRIEGKLKGAWVEELKRAWEALRLKQRRACLDLSDVNYIDAAGCQLLRQIYTDGTELVTNQLFTRYMVEQIKSKRHRNS